MSLRHLTGVRTVEIGPSVRGKAVRTLKNDKRIHFNFIQRPGFCGDCGETLRQEYAQNIFDSDYALVTRGEGNFSYRLYEVLSSGRIPVFINTDCALPYDHLIDWRNYCVWVEYDEIDFLVDKIIEFHQSISEQGFEEMQRAIRKLYESWINPVGFHENLWRYVTFE
jgi:Exostosin family